MNPTDRTYKQLIKDTKSYLSDAVRRYNKARTEKERLYKIQLVYAHYCRTAAKLCALLNDKEGEKK
jgi:hypothetical protein